MINRFLSLFIAMLMLATGARTILTQSPADQNRSRDRPAVEGVVESIDGKLQISLTNIDEAREFRGSARIILNSSSQQSESIEFKLAPQESRLIAIGSRGATGDNYTLTIHDQTGALISIKNAPVKRGTVIAPIAPAPAPATPDPTPAAPPAEVKELTIKARLAAENSSDPGARGNRVTNSQVGQPVPQNGAESIAPSAQQLGESQVEKIKKPSAIRARRGQMTEPTAEIKTSTVERPTSTQPVESTPPIEKVMSDEAVPLVLPFEIKSPTPIINASLSVNANDFKKRQAVTIQRNANVEFKLPDDFEEPKINYTLTDASGKTLAQGELILEDLRQEDAVTFADIKFDKETYDPGDSANFVVTLEGSSPFGYRLEVTAKDANTEALLSDNRKGVYSKGKAIQEFKIHIPAEARGSINVEFKAFGNLTRRLFGFVVRDIVVNDTN